MVKKLLHNIKGLFPMIITMVIVGMLSACSNELPFIQEPESELTSDVHLMFRISVSSESATRSSLPEEVGTPIENRIDPNDFAVLLFDENDSQKRLLEILYLDGTTAGNASLSPLGYGEYILNVKLDQTKYSKESRFSIVSMANWRSLNESEVTLTVGETTLDSLFQYTYLLNQNSSDGSAPEESWVPTDDSLIPMFGVLHCSLAGYSTAIYNIANPMDMGVVNLLRSLVKVEIIDNSNTTAAEILSISLNQRNTRGYLTPSLGVTENTTQVTTARVPGQIGVTNPAGFTDKSIKFRKEGNKYIAYIPEKDLSTAMRLEGRDHIDVTLRYKGYTDIRKIYLAPYDSDGNPYVPQDVWPYEWKSLLRNHVYRYTLRSIAIDTHLILTVDVQPFSCVTLKPDLGLERTEDGYIVVRDKDGHIVKYIRPDGTELFFREDNRWPYLGTFMGVFDDYKRVLTGYFPDGRSILFNYTSDVFNENDIYENLESWGIYSRPDLTDEKGNLIKHHLEETFYFENYENFGVDGGYVKLKYTHSVLDQKGRVIEEYLYPSLEGFWEHKQHEKNEGDHTNCSRIKLADYTGQRYGDKVITYYDAYGNITGKVTVIGDTETLE